MNKKQKRKIQRDKLKRVFTYANILSFSRIFMAIPLVMALDGYWFEESSRNIVCFIIMIAIFCFAKILTRFFYKIILFINIFEIKNIEMKNENI